MSQHPVTRQHRPYQRADTQLGVVDGGERNFVFNQGESNMGDMGSKDKGKREQQKKAQRSPKEKRKLKREKKNK